MHTGEVFDEQGHSQFMYKSSIPDVILIPPDGNLGKVQAITEKQFDAHATKVHKQNKKSGRRNLAAEIDDLKRQVAALQANKGA